MERELQRHQDLDVQHNDERAQLKRSKQESDNEIAVLRGCQMFQLVIMGQKSLPDLYTVSQKKHPTILLPVTSPNVDRFSKILSVAESVLNLQ